MRPTPPRSTLFPYTTLFRSYTVLKAVVPGDPSSAQPACPSITYPGTNTDLKNALLGSRSEEHTSELQSRVELVCRLLLEKKKFPPRYRSLETSHTAINS